MYNLINTDDTVCVYNDFTTPSPRKTTTDWHFQDYFYFRTTSMSRQGELPYPTFPDFHITVSSLGDIQFVADTPLNHVCRAR